jgi:hypothetical protein
MLAMGKGSEGLSEYAKQLARLAAEARRKKIPAARRREIARNAARARWAKSRKRPSRMGGR